MTVTPVTLSVNEDDEDDYTVVLDLAAHGERDGDA